MKLYSVELSPFAARVRMALYAKGLTDIEIVTPPGGTKSDEYLSINPMGKIPALVLADGTVIPESETIVEYLEDAFPAHPLRPSSAEGKAKTRLVSRVAELYILPHVQALFPQMNPKTRDQAVVDAALEKVDLGLTHLNIFISDEGFAAGRAFSTADCWLVPNLFFVNLCAMTFGKPDLLAGHPKVAAYWTAMQTDAIAVKAIGEMQNGLAAMRANAA